MDNQDSSPALIFPSVPDDFCPSGNWTQVFQQFSDIVLASGTVNIPGLANVTPQQIDALNQAVQALQLRVGDLEASQLTQDQEISALTLRVTDLEQTQVRQGSITVAAGDSILAVSFPPLDPMPSDNYTVAFTPVTNAAGATQAPIFAVQTGSQSISGFTVFIDNNVASITTVDWVAIHSA
jgi:hypothetical protein